MIISNKNLLSFLTFPSFCVVIFLRCVYLLPLSKNGHFTIYSSPSVALLSDMTNLAF